MYVQDKMDKIVNKYLGNGTFGMSSFLDDWDDDKCPVVRYINGK